MTKRVIDGIDYIQDHLGILIPAAMVREGRKKIRTSTDILPFLNDERVAEQECVVVFSLDSNNKVIKKHIVTIGLINQSQIHPREVYRAAILDNALHIFLAHNHPSGDTEPSAADLTATKRMVEVGKLVGIPLLDHVIVSREGSFSIRERYPGYFS